MQRTYLNDNVLAVLPAGSFDPEIGTLAKERVLGRELFERVGWVFINPSVETREALESGDDLPGVAMIANVYSDSSGRMLVSSTKKEFPSIGIDYRRNHPSMLAGLRVEHAQWPVEG